MRQAFFAPSGKGLIRSDFRRDFSVNCLCTVNRVARLL
jgi:hypothetical protein